MIIFGWNHFLIRQWLPHELGLTHPDEQADYHVEVRQKYFHVFWIPFFPIGKMWGIRNYADDQLYDIRHDAMAHIEEQNVEPRAPWYSYSGLIILGLLLTYGMIMA
jgi:hypothetical protein